MVGASSAAATRPPRRRRRPAHGARRCWYAGIRFTWHRRSITLGDLLAEAKDVPNGCTVACILFVHFVHTVKASRKAPWHRGLGRGDPVKSNVRPRRRRSLFLHVRASPKRRLTYTWTTKKDPHEIHPQKPSCYLPLVNSSIKIRNRFSPFRVLKIKELKRGLRAASSRISQLKKPEMLLKAPKSSLLFTMHRFIAPQDVPERGKRMIQG